MISTEQINSWADDLRGPIALHLRQKLVPIELDDGGTPDRSVVFPPTYARRENEAGSSYNIDRLSDGTLVALIDSVGSQANRMEPLFIEPASGATSLSRLVPQWWIDVPLKQNAEETTNEKIIVSLLDVGHRLGDALVRSTTLGERAKAAFGIFSKQGDAIAIAKLAPTSLVFGAWDSRETHAKLPRIVSSVIRGWDVDELRRSAQYFPPIDYSAQSIFSEETRESAEKNPKSKEAQRGMVAVPAVHTHGGIVVRGGIFRDVAVNLVALRQLSGGDDGGVSLRRYILGLALVAATEPLNGFLRQGCLLVPQEDEHPTWRLTHRTGKRESIAFGVDIVEYAEAAAIQFGVGEGGRVDFDPKLASIDLNKEDAKKSGKGKGKKSDVSDSAESASA